MIPPSFSRSSDNSESAAEKLDARQFAAISDLESLRHRPSSISRARHTLHTITESVSTLAEFLDRGGATRYLDGDIVEVCNPASGTS
jgi:hypothetical protein